MATERFNTFCGLLNETKIPLTPADKIIFQNAINQIYENKKPLSGWQCFVKETIPTFKSLTNEEGKSLTSQEKMKKASEMWKALSEKERRDG